MIPGKYWNREVLGYDEVMEKYQKYYEIYWGIRNKTISIKR
jgi:hypothetical protein